MENILYENGIQIYGLVYLYKGKFEGYIFVFMGDVIDVDSG